MNTDLMFSSRTPEWGTPSYVFDPLNREFGFTLDVCANEQNAKCPRFFTKEQDGQGQKWTGEVCWMNPPYGREIGQWIAKASTEHIWGAVVVALIPARTDTKWWHEIVMVTAEEVRLVKGRIWFDGAKSPAPFPSAIVIWREGTHGQPTRFARTGFKRPK